MSVAHGRMESQGRCARFSATGTSVIVTDAVRGEGKADVILLQGADRAEREYLHIVEPCV